MPVSKQLYTHTYIYINRYKIISYHVVYIYISYQFLSYIIIRYCIQPTHTLVPFRCSGCACNSCFRRSTSRLSSSVAYDADVMTSHHRPRALATPATPSPAGSCKWPAGSKVKFTKKDGATFGEEKLFLSICFGLFSEKKHIYSYLFGGSMDSSPALYKTFKVPDKVRIPN